MDVPAIAIGAQVAGTVMQAAAQAQAGRTQRASYEHRAQVAEMDAAAVRRAAKEEARLKAREGRKFTARQKVRYAKAGVIPTEGTPLAVLGETQREFDLDVQKILYEGRVGAARYKSQAAWERYMGEDAYRAGRYGAMTSLMTGGAKLGIMGYERGWFGKKKVT